MTNTDLVLVFTEDATRASAMVHRIATFEFRYGWRVGKVHAPLPPLTLRRLNTETWPELFDLRAWAHRLCSELNLLGPDAPHPYLIAPHAAAWLQRADWDQPLCECKADPRCSSVSGANEGIDHDT